MQKVQQCLDLESHPDLGPCRLGFRGIELWVDDATEEPHTVFCATSQTTLELEFKTVNPTLTEPLKEPLKEPLYPKAILKEPSSDQV